MSSPLSPDALWTRHAGPEVLHLRPQVICDPAFYLSMNPDVAAAGVDPLEHYKAFGQHEGRHGTTYAHLRATWPELDTALTDLASAADIRAAFDAGLPGIHELFFELLLLGDPVDRRVSHFSQRYYLDRHRDVAASGQIALLHYLRCGIAEKRATLADLRRNQCDGHMAFDPARPTLLIGLHEFSRTGAPIVGLDLARSAAQNHNVVILGLRGGVLLDDLRAHAVCVIVTDVPDLGFDYLDHPALKRIDMAVLNSVETIHLAPCLLRRGIPWAVYIHEYSDYAHKKHQVTPIIALSDLLVFSAARVRQSWADAMADMGVDMARDTILLPQYPFHAGAPDSASHASARETLASLSGHDLTGRRVVVGAGHAQWRKGTDLFVITAQIAQSMGDDSLYVWVGDGLNHEDMHFGVWLDKHLRAARANAPDSNLVVLPAGPHYRDVLRAADVFYLPSRLDPLPNVVFDAAADGCRIVIFAEGSGFDDPAYRSEPLLHTVPYGDVAAAAKMIRTLPRKTPANAPQPGPATAPVLPRILAALTARLSARPTALPDPGDYDPPFLFSAGPDHAAPRALARQKMRILGRRHIWPSPKSVRHEIAASDNWVHRHLHLASSTPARAAALPPFAVHIHASAPDTLAATLARSAALRRANMVILTADTPQITAQIARIAERSALPLTMVEAHGPAHPVLPFLRLFHDGPARMDPQLIWCHIDLKTTQSRDATGDPSRQDHPATLPDDDLLFTDALHRIAAPGMGFVAPFTPYRQGWGETRRLLPRFAGRFPAPLPAHPLLVATANTVWTRARVATRMHDLFGPAYPWPNAPLPDEGPEFDLIRKLWPSVAAMEGLDSLFIDTDPQSKDE